MRRTGKLFRELVPLLWMAWVDNMLTTLDSSSPRLRSKGGASYMGHWRVGYRGMGKFLRPWLVVGIVAETRTNRRRGLAHCPDFDAYQPSLRESRR